MAIIELFCLPTFLVDFLGDYIGKVFVFVAGELSSIGMRNEL